MTEPIVSRTTYALTFGALLVLTALTTFLAYFDFGSFNLVIEIGIAVMKAALIVSVFMHAMYEFRLVWVIVGAALLWFLILLGLTTSDYISRAWH